MFAGCCDDCMFSLIFTWVWTSIGQLGYLIRTVPSTVIWDCFDLVEPDELRSSSQSSLSEKDSTECGGASSTEDQR